MEKIIISGNNLAEYIKLKAQGAIVLWVGEGKICLEKPLVPKTPGTYKPLNQ